jgi:hypothetical protein
MLEKLIELLDRRLKNRNDFIKEDKKECVEIVNRSMYYAIDTYWITGLITLNEANELWNKYGVKYSF